MNVEQLVLDVLNEQSYDVPVVSPILLEENSIAVMGMTTNEYRHYYDGAKEQSFLFQVLVRHDVQFEAYRTLLQIVNDLLRTEGASNSDSYDFKKITITEDPKKIVQADEYYIFGAQFSADLYIRGVVNND
ncbi:hypothetical protein [Halalkalibacter hemicellulosilyticus]|uniref:Minor capsid protein n=1 Tax=Halalkalibacter hemicellulosilyticusJCM 9152 TaxID=1236971 RepID=W4QKS6_9BACI|nr:hypothetical protein [Halalkalibacter hemicellulosilyticus]GAE31919.1 hypothetical protein JCM9152_3419 [Halalkalibacter hemicellulosilyticusJCM 9152]